MTDLKDQVLFLSKSDQTCGVIEIIGNRFFQQDMHASFEKTARHLEMRPCRHGNGDRVDLSQHGAVIGEAARAIYRRDLLGPHPVAVGQRDQFGAA